MAKDENRKFNNCIFCGLLLTEKTISKEHIFGKSIAKNLLEVSEDWKVHDSVTKTNLKGGGEFRFLTSKSVCRDCNSGWMKTDMDHAIPVMESIFASGFSSINHRQKIILWKYLARIAFICDVESSSLDLIEKNKEPSTQAENFGMSNLFQPVFSINDRQDFKLGKHHPLLKINIGTHNGRLGVNPEFNLVTLGVEVQT